MTFRPGVTSGLSLGDVTSYFFRLSGLWSQKSGGRNRREPGYAEPRVESSQASGDLACPWAGVGLGIFLPDVICSSASAGGQLHNRTTDTAVIVSVILASPFKALLCRPVMRHASPPPSPPPENSGF